MQCHTKKYCIIILSVLLVSPSFAQYRDFLKYDYEWDDKVSNEKLDKQYSKYSAAFVEDHTALKFRQLKNEFMHAYVERKGILQVNHDDFQQKKDVVFNLPESFDPPIDGGALYALEDNYAKWIDSRIIFFKARVIHPDGTWEEVTPQFLGSLKPVRVFERNIDQYTYRFSVQDLNPGDRLQYHYKIEIPYQKNWHQFTNMRIFMHGKLPFQNRTLELVLHKNHRVKLKGMEPDRSFQKGKYIHRKYEAKNLHPVMNEPAARPHESLPHLICNFNINNEYLFYQHTLSNELLPIGHWLVMLRSWLRDPTYHVRLARRNMILDRGSERYREYLETLLRRNKNNSLKAMRAFHNELNETFNYRNDDAVYDEEDFSLEKLGRNIADGILRDISRENVYNRTLTRFDLPYDLGVIYDKRLGNYGSDFYGTLMYPDFVYLTDGSVGDYFYPRKGDRYYHSQELPFYWEGSEMLQFNLDRLWRDPLVDQKWVKTKSSVAGVQERSTRVELKVNLDAVALNFDAEVYLNGQWSTLCRGNYEGRGVDPNINPAYAQLVYNLPGETQLKKQEKIFHKYEPYPRSKYELSYQNPSALKYAGESGSIALKDFFNVVTWPVNFDNRMLPYHFDFLFVDRFEYNITMSEAVNWKNLEVLNFEFRNEIAELLCEAKPLDNKTLRLKVTWLNLIEKVGQEQMHLLQMIFNTLEQLNASALEFELMKVEAD